MSFKNISPHNSGSIDCTTQEFETLGRSCKRLCGSARSIMSSDATRMILSSTAAPDSTCSMHSTETNKKKPEAERRRRRRINGSVARLKSLVLEGIGEDVSAGVEVMEEMEPSQFSKLEKADILEMTVRYVERLNQRLPETQKTNRVPNTQYEAGFSRCCKDVETYLRSFEDAALPHVHERVSSHLNSLMDDMISEVKTSDINNENSYKQLSIAPTVQPIFLIMNPISTANYPSIQPIQVLHTFPLLETDAQNLSDPTIMVNSVAQNNNIKIDSKNFVASTENENLSTVSDTENSQISWNTSENSSESHTMSECIDTLSEYSVNLDVMTSLCTQDSNTDCPYNDDKNISSTESITLYKCDYDATMSSAICTSNHESVHSNLLNFRVPKPVDDSSTDHTKNIDADSDSNCNAANSFIDTNHILTERQSVHEEGGAMNPPPNVAPLELPEQNMLDESSVWRPWN